MSQNVINPYRFVVAEPETFTWSKCNGTNELTLKAELAQAGGAKITSGNAMIGAKLNSVTWKYNRRGTSGANSYYVFMRLYDSDGSTVLATSDSGDNLLVTSITTSTDYNSATENTFNFSSPATITEDGYILTETNMPYHSGGSPEVWTSTSDCTANTNFVEYKSTNTPPITDFTGKDMVGSAVYTA